MPISDCWLMIQQIKTVLTTINWLVIKILFSLAVAHSDSVLTWDFDNELSRCTYAGKLQWAPQWALARAEGWWVFGFLRLAWYVNCTLTAISGLCGVFFFFFYCICSYSSCCGRNWCSWRGGGSPSYLQGCLPTSAWEGGLTWGDPGNCQRLDIQAPSSEGFCYHPGITIFKANTKSISCDEVSY